MEIHSLCPHCKSRVEISLTQNLEDTTCPQCHERILRFATDDFISTRVLNQCPVCGCPHLYRQKDFNRKLGLIILFMGILLAFFTYGLSLVAVAIIDWVLYRRIQEVGVCYDCGSVFRGFSVIPALDLFQLELNDHYRTVKARKL